MTSGIDPDANLAAIADGAARAAAAGACMLFLPEMALLLDRDRKRSAAHMAKEAESGWPVRLAAIARDHGIWLHGGSAPFTSDDGNMRVNRSLIFDAAGKMLARYDKVHMFDVDLPSGESWRESNSYRGGDRLACVDSPAGQVGLSICFDLRFPELYAALRAGGADLLAIPAAFTVPTGRAHWHVLLRARAIETSCYVVAAAQAGHHTDGRETFGHSLVIDPWGQIVAEAEDNAGQQEAMLLFADINAGEIAKARQAIPLERSRAVRALSL